MKKKKVLILWDSFPDEFERELERKKDMYYAFASLYIISQESEKKKKKKKN